MESSRCLDLNPYTSWGFDSNEGLVAHNVVILVRTVLAVELFLLCSNVRHLSLPWLQCLELYKRTDLRMIIDILIAHALYVLLVMIELILLRLRILECILLEL